MQIDIYLGFTSCQWNCIFCRKGDDLVHFPRPSYVNNVDLYHFFHFNSPEECYGIFLQGFLQVDSINISWNDPLSWLKLPEYIAKIRATFPGVLLTLRMSNTLPLNESYIELFDRFEFSIYGHTRAIHNAIVGSSSAWDILHNNLELFTKTNSTNKLFFQTIFLYENIEYMKDILFFIRDNSYPGNPIKIIYPYFMPSLDRWSLPKKSEVLKKLFILMWNNFLLQYCDMVNFSIPSSLTSFFRSYSD